jgi:tetrahydromethanopterin S-methyltransferase subunit H
MEAVFMYKFNLSQKVIDIAGVKIGGQPGEWPTVDQVRNVL